MREEESRRRPLARCARSGGVVTDLRRTYTKKGDLMARFVLEDLQAAMEVFVFPKTMADYGALIENDAILVVRGRLDTREEEPKIVCMEVSRPLLERGEEDLHVALPLGVLTDTTLVGSQGRPERAPGPLLGAPARRGQGAAPRPRVQRGLPQRSGGRAETASRTGRRPVVKRTSDQGGEPAAAATPAGRRTAGRLGKLPAEPVDLPHADRSEHQRLHCAQRR